MITGPCPLDPNDQKLAALLVEELKKPNETQNMKLAKEALEAWDRLITATRYAFNEQDYEEDDDGNAKGLTDEEILLLMFDYTQWMESTKKNLNGLPTSLDSTVQASLMDAKSHIDVSSDSGSIAIAQ